MINQQCYNLILKLVELVYVGGQQKNSINKVRLKYVLNSWLATEKQDMRQIFRDLSFFVFENLIWHHGCSIIALNAPQSHFDMC